MSVLLLGDDHINYLTAAFDAYLPVPGRDPYSTGLALLRANALAYAMRYDALHVAEAALRQYRHMDVGDVDLVQTLAAISAWQGQVSDAPSHTNLDEWHLVEDLRAAVLVLVRASTGTGDAAVAARIDQALTAGEVQWVWARA